VSLETVVAACGSALVWARQSPVIGRHGQGWYDHGPDHAGQRAPHPLLWRQLRCGRLRLASPGGLLGACRAAYRARMGETDRQRRAREASHRYFTEALARMFDPDRKNRTAGRIIDLWDARRARGAEPLFHPTIGGAIRAGRPWLTCYCPGCGVVGEIDLRKIDRHPDASIESLIPHLSCQRCSPHPPFARLIGLAARPGALVHSRSAR